MVVSVPRGRTPGLFLKKVLDILGAMWYNLKCQGEEKRLKVLLSIPATLLPSGNTQVGNDCTQLGKTFSKKFEKPLDNSILM